MKKRRALVLKAFLSQYPKERSEVLERFLPDEERTLLSELPPLEAKEPSGFKLEDVHWSWFLPTLKTYPKEDQGRFLWAMSETARRGIQQALELPLPQQEISPSGRLFLAHVLFHSLMGHDGRMVPKEFLPPSSLNALVQWDKKALVHLIERLSLYDLAHDLRQIVETKILKKIYSFLTEEERKFLKLVGLHQQPHGEGRIGFEKWDGTEEHFRSLLHRKGIARLAAALSGQDPDLIWYICHQLDIGRGTVLYKGAAKEPLPGMSEWAVRQVEELISLKEAS